MPYSDRIGATLDYYYELLLNLCIRSLSLTRLSESLMQTAPDVREPFTMHTYTHTHVYTFASDALRALGL